MAERVKLRDYQQSILDRMNLVRSDASGAVESFLGVQIGEQHVLVSLLDVSETLVMTEIQPIPLVKPWFLGISNVRGVLYSINDLGQMLNDQPSEISSDTRILLISNNFSTNIGILVDRLVGLRQKDAFKLRDDTDQESICFRSELYEDSEARVWRVLDCEKLVNSKQLETPYIT